MKITIIVNKINLAGGGENQDIFFKVKSLQRMGHEVTLVTAFSKYNKIKEGLTCRIVEEHVLSNSAFSLQKSAVDILNRYSGITDVYYLIGSTLLFGGGWYKLFSRHSRPMVGDINGYADFIEEYFKKYPLWPISSLSHRTGWPKIKHGLRITLERTLGVFLINRLDKLIIMTKTTASYYIRAGVKKNKITIIPSFQDIEGFQKQPRFSNPFQGFGEKFHILSAGRIYIDKGFDLLIEAFARLGCRDVCMLHVVGEGEQKEELMEMVKKLGLENQIRFYRWQDQKGLVRFFQHADLFVQPARIPEPLNRTAVQAMALGVPLVVTNTGSDKWVSEEVAKIFINGDAEDLKKKIEEVYSDKFFQESARLNGPKRAKDFDYRVLIKNLDHEVSSL